MSMNKSSVKILYAVDLLEPWDESFYAHRNNDLFSSLKDLGFEIEILTRWGYPHDKGIIIEDENSIYEIHECPIHLMNNTEGLLKYNFDEYMNKAEPEISKKIDQISPDIVISTGDFHNALPVINACKRLKIPVFYDIGKMTVLEAKKEEKNYEKKIDYELQALSLSDGILVPTDQFKKWLIQQGIKSENIFKLPNSVRENKIKKIVRKKSLLSLRKKFTIGFRDDLDKYSRFSNLLVSVSELNKLKPKNNIRLLVEGDGIYRHRLEEEAKRLGLNKKIVFKGKIKKNNLESFYEGVDVSVIPDGDCLSDTLFSNLEIVRSMSYGIPVVASDISPNLEYIKHGINGLTYDNKDPESLTNLLVEIFEGRINLSDLSLRSIDKCRLDYTYQRRLEDLIPFLIAKSLCVYGLIKPLDYQPMNKILMFAINKTRNSDLLFTMLIKILTSFGNSREVSNALTCLIRNFGLDHSRIIINSLFKDDLTNFVLDYRQIRDLSTIFNRCTDDEIKTMQQNLKINSDQLRWIFAGLSLREATSKRKLNILFNKKDYSDNYPWAHRHNFELYCSEISNNDITKNKSIRQLKQILLQFDVEPPNDKDTLIENLIKIRNSHKKKAFFKKNDFNFSYRLFNLIDKDSKLNLKNISIDDLLILLFPISNNFNNSNFEKNNFKNFNDLERLSEIYRQIFSIYKDSKGPLNSLVLEAGYLYFCLNRDDVKFNIVLVRRIMEAGLVELGLEIQSTILQQIFDQNLLKQHMIKSSKYIVKNKLDYSMVPLKKYKSVNKNIDYWQNKLIEMIKFESLSSLNNLVGELELTQRPKYYKFHVGSVKVKNNKNKLVMELKGNISTDSNAKSTAALMSFKFFDEDYQEIDPDHIIGLSYSQKVGYYSYFNQNNSSGEFIIKFDLPRNCFSFSCGLRTWHKPNKFNILPKMSVKVSEIEGKELSPKILKDRIIHMKINDKWIKSMPKLKIKRKSEKKPSGILYFTHMALPFENNGYSTRTHGLLSNLKYRNPNFIVQSRFGYPEDKNKLRNLVIDGVSKEYLIDDIIYKFDSDKYSGFGNDELSYIHSASRKLLEIVIDNPPSIIQAASNHVNGAIAMNVAKATNTPFIYEVRGLWHMSKVSRIPSFYNNKEYKSMDAAEIAVCKNADMVLAITHAVRYYLIEKGVDGSKIYVLPNGVDSKRFFQTPKAKKLQKELNLPEGPVIGYVGSFVRYEGLDLLVEAFSEISKAHKNVSLLLVGDGDIRPELENQVNKLGIKSKVFFTGRVPHDQVRLYHSLIDIAPFPRTPDIVCEFVSPLKPFESMAMGQVVVASDVAALKEIITDGENGRLFEKGNYESLFHILDELLNDDAEIKKLKKNGQEWVKKNRDWSEISSYLDDLHNFILNKKNKPELMGSGEKVNLRNGKIVKFIDRKPNIMAIMDEFSATALEPDSNLLRPRIDNYREILANENIDILLVESAWKGNNGNWHRKVGWYGEEEIYELKDLIDKCRDKKIPTIFYNKEDPIHFSRFSKTSAMFDHIFTTDEGCIKHYLDLEDSKIKTVDSIQFAAQPEVHNPYNVEISKRKGIAFAGTYYAGKYIDRCKKMDMLFDASLDNDLVIYDRQSDGENPQYVFPTRFSSNIKSKLEYSEMLEKHREHLIFLNVNSVENSLTMASRRIFEIPASGACLVSGPGLAMTETYGNVIPIIESPQQAKSTIKSLMEDLDFLKYTIQESRRLVIQKHLNSHRLNSMLSSAGLIVKEKNISELLLKISDTSSSLSELYLWLARQNINIINVLIPKKPSLNHELLLENMLLKRGIKFYENDDDIFRSKLEIFDITSLDHNFLEMMCNEYMSTSKEITYVLDGHIIAKIHGDKKLGKNILHHYHSNYDSELEISSISQINIKNIPQNLILCGHDLKFAGPIISIYEEMGINIMVDKWKNHTAFNEKFSRELLSKADAIWCEWALGNVEWYSKNAPKDMPIFVRYHLQERNYDYLKNSELSNISAVAFVCKYYEENARSIGQINEKTNSVIIPNILVNNKNHVSRNDNYSIGFVGIVPARKRFDKAIDLLEKLLKKDKRYKLKVIGKMPDEYAWLKDREEEKIYYEQIFNRIEASKELKENIEFLGFVDDIDLFYSSVGHVISTSDFESFHLTLADGPLHGASAHTLPWSGSETIYTELWINKNIHQMSEKIHLLNLTNKVSYHAYQQNHHLIKKMQPERVALDILTALSGGQVNDK